MGHLAAHLTLATSRDAAPLRPRPGKGAANYQNYHLLPGRGVASSLRMGAAPLTCPAREMDPFFFLSFLSFPPFRTFASVSNFSCLENGRSKKNKRECVLSTNTFLLSLSLSIVWKYWGRIPAREFAWRSVSQARDIVFHSIAFSYANYTSREVFSFLFLVVPSLPSSTVYSSTSNRRDNEKRVTPRWTRPLTTVFDSSFTEIIPEFRNLIIAIGIRIV